GRTYYRARSSTRRIMSAKSTRALYGYLRSSECPRCGWLAVERPTIRFGSKHLGRVSRHLLDSLTEDVQGFVDAATVALRNVLERCDVAPTEDELVDLARLIVLV